MDFLLTEIIMFPYKNNFCRGTFLWLISIPISTIYKNKSLWLT